jgi:hypothetical protein
LISLFVLGMLLLAALALAPAAFAHMIHENAATACACGGVCQCEECDCVCDGCDGQCADCSTCCQAATATLGDKTGDACPGCRGDQRACGVASPVCCN